MQPLVLYFSRTGNTNRFAEAISESAKAPIFSISSCEPSVVENYDLLIMGTPVEGASPTKEIMAFTQTLPQGNGKKTILFCTYRMFGNSRTLKKLGKELTRNGYEVILNVSKKGMKPDQPADFSDQLNEIKKTL